MQARKKLLYKPPPPEDYSSNFCKLYIVIGISFVFITGEFIGGYISKSISVISDAFHLVTDLLGFGISYIFIYFSRKEPTQKMSFGFHRMEVLGALGNLFIIWFLAIFMIYEATIRIIDKEFVAEPLAMLIVGVAGLAINIIMYFVLHSGSHSHGLMSQPCDHHHQTHDNDPNPSNCTTSFCNELICDDNDCLKQINMSHCHFLDPKGEKKIHIHDEESKKKAAQLKDSSLDQLNNSKPQINNKVTNQELNQSSLNHKHGQNCKHDHSPHKQNKPKYELSPLKKPPHKHTDNCGHTHPEKQKQNQQKQKQHKHGEGCKHDHSNKQNHGHDHSHKHDHKHGHDHNGHDHNDHHDHNHEQHGHNHEHHESISMKAAVLHALSDVIQSIGLLISSLFIFFLGSDKGAQVTQWNDWHYFDPISTYIFSVIVICSTFPIIKNCYYIIMEATPSTQVARQIKRQFEQCPGVVDVHDLHIWNLRPGKNILIAHVFAKDGAQREVLTNLTQICRKKKIYHSTLQVEQQNWKNHDEYILCDHDIH